MGTDKTQDWLNDRKKEIENADYREEVKESILDYLDAYDPDSFRLDPPMRERGNERESAQAVTTRLQYASTLHRAAQQVDLLEAPARALNRLAEQRMTGEHPTAKDEGLSTNTIHGDQTAWRAFYRFHESHPKGTDTEIDADDIVLVDRDTDSVDERDMFEPEEIEAMRDACQNKRDRALLECLIFTGQRHNALRMLRVKDMQPDEGNSGKMYLPNVEGLKGAEGKRPLLGAQKHVREYKRSHPTGEPEDAFFTQLWEWENNDNIEQGDHLSRNGFGRISKKIGNRAGIEKPCNPHNFRHYFVTMAVANHDMSMDTVRHLIGHAAGSRELERTYQHLVDEDHIENAELDMGIRDERDESFTPTTCFQCNEPLTPEDNYCRNCGYQYGPESEDIKEETSERQKEQAVNLSDPEVMEALLTVTDALGEEELRRIGQLNGDYEDADAFFDSIE